MSDELRIEYIKLSDLKRYPRNPKDHDLGLMHESIARFGFKDPMAIDEGTGQLVEGHGRLDTLEDKEQTGAALPQHMKLIDGEWAAPVIRGLTFASDHERRAYTIAHNKTTEMGGWHDELLADELKELAEAGTTFVGTGYDLEDLDLLMADLNFTGQADAPPPEPERAAAAVTPKTIYGVRCVADGEDAENELIEILAEHGYEAIRLSEG